MSVRMTVAVTDREWFDTLRSESEARKLEEVNFWSPSPQNFRALESGEFLLFKLRRGDHPDGRDDIVGGGIFFRALICPCSHAWETFGVANGAKSALQMRTRIAQYRQDQHDHSDFDVGCRILTQPFFLDEKDWIPVPWHRNIVRFKTFNTSDGEGHQLWDNVQDRLARQPLELGEQRERYATPQLIKPRIGQGGFRELITDIYGRRCAVTRERTLPALEAAHIRPYSSGGEHRADNGLLLRRDIHTLFDHGYVTVTPEMRFEVSGRIREKFENGRDYYALHGKRVVVPRPTAERPDVQTLEWHNDRVFLG
ncbi:MAG: HNH endonuclease [Gammaproteobacteria bacterium]|nr:HNH endonuclease [Gammaproteobacteria bacterium]